MNASCSVVVATRNRAALVANALRSILATGIGPDRVLVVDQSDDDHTAQAMEPWSARGVGYMRAAGVGLARAHNAAIAMTRTEIVAITDDDCEVAPDWLDAIERAFATDAKIAAVFGNVHPGSHDPEQGLITGYVRRRPFLARSTRDKTAIDGIGACMALRRRVWEELGGFDERLGAGTYFAAANDGDFALRVLRAGLFVYEASDIEVVHTGFRSGDDARSLLCGYAFGTGAMLAKHVRCRTPYAKRILGRLAWRWVRGRRHEAARLGGNRFPFRRLAAFLRGIFWGMLMPVDPTKVRFEISRSGESDD